MKYSMQLRFSDADMVKFLEANGYHSYLEKMPIISIDPTSNAETETVVEVTCLMKDGHTLMPNDKKSYLEWREIITEEFRKVLHKKLLTI